MFTFIAGLQPKKRLLDAEPRLCPACKVGKLQKQRVDEMLSVFFIPLFPIERGEPFFVCPQCGNLTREGGSTGQGRPVARTAKCLRCGRRLEQDFVYCPRCGERL